MKSTGQNLDSANRPMNLSSYKAEFMLKSPKEKVMQEVIIDEQLSAKETEEIKAEVHRIFEEVKKNKEKMDDDQRDIERMKARTRAMLEQLEKAA